MKKINSPCLRVCIINDEDICTTCFRSGIEIIEWHSYDDQEKIKVWRNIEKREKQQHKILG